MCDYHAVKLPLGADGRPQSLRIKQINAESEGNQVRAICLFEYRTPEAVCWHRVQTFLMLCCVWGQCVSPTHSVQMKQKLWRTAKADLKTSLCVLYGHFAQTKRENFPWFASLQSDLSTQKWLCAPLLSVSGGNQPRQKMLSVTEDCLRLYV